MFGICLADVTSGFTEPVNTKAVYKAKQLHSTLGCLTVYTFTNSAELLLTGNTSQERVENVLNTPSVTGIITRCLCLMMFSMCL